MCWVFISVRGLSLVAANRGHSSSRCAGLSLSRPLVAEHRLQTRRLSSCGSRAQLLRGMWIFPDQGSNPCPLHWQADSQPLHHQGSPIPQFWMSVVSWCCGWTSNLIACYTNIILLTCDLSFWCIFGPWHLQILTQLNFPIFSLGWESCSRTPCLTQDNKISLSISF